MIFRKIVRNKSAIKLKDLLKKDYHPTFTYKGYYYCALTPHDSMYTKLIAYAGYIPCLNLKSMTIRGVDRNEYVETIKVNVDIIESEIGNKKVDNSSIEDTFVVLV